MGTRRIDCGPKNSLADDSTRCCWPCKG